MNTRTARCPACEAQARLLAVLGRMEHYRCDGCGADFRRAASPQPMQPGRNDPECVWAAAPLPEPVVQRARVRIGVLER